MAGRTKWRICYEVAVQGSTFEGYRTINSDYSESKIRGWVEQTIPAELKRIGITATVFCKVTRMESDSGSDKQNEGVQPGS